MRESVEIFKKKLAEIQEISTMPHVMTRIMEIITDEGSSAGDLADEIRKDTSLTAKILKIVNSAYYGFYREIDKVSDAVVVLGFNEIRRLSLAISVLDMFRGIREGHRLMFWNHSFICAAMCDILAKERHMEDRGAFTAGLLHDIGKSILDQYFSDMFADIQTCMYEREIKAHEAEQLLYEFDHADVGYWLSERWNLPVGLSEAIHYHHKPESANEIPELTKLVHLGDELSNEYMNLKARGLSMNDIAASKNGESLTDEKIGLLVELEKRIKDSTIAEMLM
jgi:HD-like signal output (HDOD) protein